MANNRNEVVIVGGGIVGISTAFFLGQAGVKSVVIERDSIGSHSSGFACGLLGSLSGSGIPGPVFPIAQAGMRIHSNLSRHLFEETGVDVKYRELPSLALSFSDAAVKQAKADLAWQQAQGGYSVRWLEAAEAKAIEPRVSDSALGAVYTEGTADVEPYRFLVALAQAVEKLGATIRHGRVIGLSRDRDRVSGVVLDKGEVPCDTVVLATGPWCGEASSWLGVAVKVRPLKGQILRLRAPGRPFECRIAWEDNYAVSKPDGLLWAGTTEEESFEENPTHQARDGIMSSLLEVIPSVLDAHLVRQTACLRPLSSDGLPLLGQVRGWEGVYVATGAGRKGIVLGPVMGQIIANLITTGVSEFSIEAFHPNRFTE